MLQNSTYLQLICNNIIFKIFVLSEAADFFQGNTGEIQTGRLQNLVLSNRFVQLRTGEVQNSVFTLNIFQIITGEIQNSYIFMISGTRRRTSELGIYHSYI